MQEKNQLAPNLDTARGDGKLAWTKPQAQFYDVESVRSSTTSGADNSGNTNASLS